MVGNVIAIANGKGGVGKTSLSANLSGLLANSGWRTLAVDLDQQGNLGADLGYLQDERFDEGHALWDALVDGQALKPPLMEVRPRLDVVAGGRWTARADAVLTAEGVENRQLLRVALESLQADYDVIVLDCPPAGGVMVTLALAAARGLVIPVRADAASLKGLEVMARHYQQAKQGDNPDLELLGVVLFAVGLGSTSIREEVKTTLRRALGTIAPVFDAVIRHSERAAYDMRLAGELAHEYELGAEKAKRRRLGLLRQGSRDVGHRRRYSTTANGVAEDYACLAQEIMSRFRPLAYTNASVR